MTHNIWTSFIFASLILFGESAFASENRLHADSEEVSSGDTVQVSQSVFPDHNKSKNQPVPASTKFKQNKVDHRYQTLSSATPSVSYTPKYNSFSPRAPPIPIK